jgi:hypothetical protein
MTLEKVRRKELEQIDLRSARADDDQRALPPARQRKSEAGPSSVKRSA